MQLTASVASVSYDPISTNNQSTANTVVTGATYNAPPLVTQLSPALIQAGSNTLVLTVDGEGFTTGSSILWNGQQLPTTFLSSGQLTASIDSSLIANLGWAAVSVSTPTPGGGISAALPFTIYQVLNVPASAMAYDPFTRKLYATIPSTSTAITGNSIVAVDPVTDNVGSPINVGSEPNLLSETSDGNYLYIGLSGAKSLGRFNLLNQTLDLTVPLPTNASYVSGNAAASAIATIPGSDSSLAVEIDSFYGIGILDISGTTGTFRASSSGAYNGDNPVFADATHFYAYDSYTTGAEFYRYAIDSTGVHEVDGTTLDGMGGFGGKIALDAGLVYGTGGGIINPSTTPPSQVAVLPLGVNTNGTSFTGEGAVPYAAESKSFNAALNFSVTSPAWLERFDTQHATLENLLPLPGNGSVVANMRWGQDGLAYIVPSAVSTQPATNEIVLIRGAFVVPAELVANAAPSLNAPAALTHGVGNTMLAVTGTRFLPGATVFWNGSARTTNFVDSGDLTVAIPASDLHAAGTITLTAQNPGSAVSGSVTLSVQ